MKVADIKRAACVGGGVIGSSWAIQFAMRGLAVTLYDINDEQLKRSEAQMHKSLDALEQFNAITPERRGRSWRPSA
ncbi:3-hydroxyacyl-CoA dehydrogenase NAD-binding domain-containing protein [Flavonifractor plautii]|uniref:3-hydroxyacyl-CoA dehydrogenase NAD-binding domain-containing protein n=1 Tax=Flavonifractor plautii TaxID=292800 RepID=UPI003A20F7FA